MDTEVTEKKVNMAAAIITPQYMDTEMTEPKVNMTASFGEIHDKEGLILKQKAEPVEYGGQGFHEDHTSLIA
jgi:hypothetical protein